VQAQAAVVGCFHTGELNLLLATNIGSEGMDFQKCEMVVAFEPPTDVTSYIQVCCPPLTQLIAVAVVGFGLLRRM
jgi:ERCC4-related helicase